MTLGSLIGRLDKPRRTATGYTALCPAHKDRDPSLSISEGSGRKILLHCFSGCSPDSIVSAIGLELKDLFVDSDPWIARGNGNGSQTTRNASKSIEAVYPYTDARGAILYENVRYRPKDFRQRRPDGSGGYIYNLTGIDRVPYRLPDLMAAMKSPDAEVWLTEGEKDADNLRALGFTATSFKSWTSSLNPYIKGAHAVLFRDHDVSGIKQANDAARVMSEVAESVKVIDLFTNEPLPEKHGLDVSNFIEELRAHGAENYEIAERLSVIADGASAWAITTESVAPRSLFKTKTANSWIKEASCRPVPKMLFGELWFEHDLCIMFSDTGLGKTVLGVQIGDSISRGAAVNGFAMEAPPQKILYMDFELSDMQFQARYAVKGPDYFVKHYEFNDNFVRSEIDAENADPREYRDFDTYVHKSIEAEIVRTKARILIVDNITYLKSATETAKDALPLMKELQRLKKKYQLSILALAHTPKRDMSRALSVNDLQGSKMISNFADSVFAIGSSSKDKNLRYLKQIKVRNAEFFYDSENVANCQLTKSHNFLQFEFIGLGREREHLNAMSDADRNEIIAQAKSLSGQGKSQREISRELGLSLGAVNKYVRL